MAHHEQSTGLGRRHGALAPQARLGRRPPLASGSSCLLFHGVLPSTSGEGRASMTRESHGGCELDPRERRRRDMAPATWDQAVFKKRCLKSILYLPGC